MDINTIRAKATKFSFFIETMIKLNFDHKLVKIFDDRLQQFTLELEDHLLVEIKDHTFYQKNVLLRNNVLLQYVYLSYGEALLSEVLLPLVCIYDLKIAHNSFSPSLHYKSIQSILNKINGIKIYK